MDLSSTRELSFGRTADIKLPISFRLTRLEGQVPRKTFRELQEHPELRHLGTQQPGLSDLFVTVELWSEGRRLSLPQRTRHKAFTKSYAWNEFLTIPVKYSSLPPTAQLAFTVFDCIGAGKPTPVGGSTMRLFEQPGYLRQGEQRLYLHREVAADGSAETTTPHDVDLGPSDEMGRLEGLVRKFERGDIPKLEWLDRLTFKEIERVHAAEAAKSPHIFLYIDMLHFDFPIIFAEPELPIRPLPATTGSIPLASPTPLETELANVFKIHDPDAYRENLVEAKHRRLVRSQRTGRWDRELKPDARSRDDLNMILSYPPTQLLQSEEKDLLWKYRFYLTRLPQALTKFLKAVSWNDTGEVKQAVEVLLPMWTEVGVSDALEILGPGSRDGRVRAFAVSVMARADDEELLLYLLQLVQALKFEPPPSDGRSLRSSHSNAGAAFYSPSSSGTTVGASMPGTVGGPTPTDDSGLAEFLVQRGVKNAILGNALHWYLMVECEDKSEGGAGKMFARVAFRFMTELVKIPDGAARRNLLRRQGELVATLSGQARLLRASKDKREKKIDRLRAYITDPKHGLASMEPLPLPINGRIVVDGIDPERSTIFKSNLLPLRLWFTCPSPIADKSGAGPATDGKPAHVEYPLIFKNGDDLRQDQLVVQLFTLMDRLLLKENLDLRIKTYSVLATGLEEGMIEFVPSMTLAAAMSEHGSLQGYLRVNHPDVGSVATYDIAPRVLDTFVRSCAGYCVLTYILGVGDRHLDNLMLAPDGHFFHVDFGYILGRDPKPFPPPVKLSREMIDAMGGPLSPHYLRFKSLCHTAFANLRKQANLILNLVGLMVNSGVQDIKLEPDKAVAKIQENFLLHLNEEEASQQFEVLLNQTSVLTAVFDVIHDWAQYWRS